MKQLYLIRCNKRTDGMVGFTLGKTYLGELVDSEIFNIYRDNTLHNKLKAYVSGSFVKHLSFKDSKAFLDIAGYEWQILESVISKPEYRTGMNAMLFDEAMMLFTEESSDS